MNDKHGRTIEYMRISVTDRCNLRCVHCMPRGGVTPLNHADILRYEEIAAVAQEAAKLGIRKLRITGGEPLVRPQLHRLVAMLKGIPGIDAVLLTSNGVLLKEQLPQLLEAGLDGVNISLNAMERDAYLAFTGRDEFERAMEGLHAALACPNLTVKVNCVLTEGREEQLLKLATLARDTRAAVRFIELMPIGMGARGKGLARNDMLKLLSDAFGQAIFAESEDCSSPKACHPSPSASHVSQPCASPTVQHPERKDAPQGPAVHCRFAGFRSEIGLISALSERFCARCNRIRLTADGKLKSCLAYPAEEDARSLLRGGADSKALQAALICCIENKPLHHPFGLSKPQEERLMSQIGG